MKLLTISGCYLWFLNYVLLWKRYYYRKWTLPKTPLKVYLFLTIWKKKNKSRYFQGKCLVTASILELFQQQNSSFLIQLCWIDTKPGYFLSLQAKSIFISATDQSFHIDMLNAFYLCFKLIATGNYSRYWLILKLYCPIFIQLAVLKNLNQNDFCFYFCFHTGYYFLPC